MSEGFLPRDRLDTLISALRARGMDVLGPRLEDGIIRMASVDSAADFPRGRLTDHGPGRYRLVEGDAPDGDRLFDWAAAPAALKPLLFAPTEVLIRTRRDKAGHLHFETVPAEVRPTAVIGARACDLAALALNDAHFMGGGRVADAHYAARRRALFVVAVDCHRSARTCFCASTGDGPAVDGGADLALAELADGFLVRASSDAGRALLSDLDTAPATPAQHAAARSAVQAAADAQQRYLPGEGLAERLWGALDHPRWDDVARRCLSCGNCTALCPTCFCHDVDERPALDGRISETERHWDSCFTATHGHMAGWRVRPDVRSRYRQWVTHKLAGWVDQYGRGGCTGCGRCINGCPAAIDLVAEVHAIVDGPGPGEGGPGEGGPGEGGPGDGGEG
ncbi:MAG: 4Fe-4S dicluster domain-containing protein [Gammaproteobacteria bacterium]